MADPITLGTLAITVGIAALKGLYGVKEWGFGEIEGSIAKDLLDLLNKVLGGALKRAVLKKTLYTSSISARDWLADQPDYIQIEPILDEVCNKDWKEFSAALTDVSSDLQGWRVRASIRRIFAVDGHADALRSRAADAFYEALLRTLLPVPEFSATASRLLADLDERRRAILIGDLRMHVDRKFDALLDSKPLVIWPYQELPSNDGRLSELLIAKHGVVPFFGRKAEVQDLIDWCVTSESKSARLYLGDGGAGKTRFFAEACERLTGFAGEPWTAGWIDLGRYTVEPARLDVLLDRDGGVLLGVDYAGSETATVIQLASHISRTGHRAKVRLVLLERDQGHWWKTLRSEVGVLIANAEVIRLASLGDAEERVRFFALSYSAFREFFPNVQSRHDDFNPGAPEYANTLFVVMAAALAAAGDPAPTAGKLLDRVLDHERKWRERRSIVLNVGVDAEHLETVSALGALVDGVLEREPAIRLIRKLSGFEELTDVEIEKICRAIGGDVSSLRPFLPSLKPDRLGERILETIFEGMDSDNRAVAQKLLDGVFGDEDEFLIARGSRVLARMAAHDPDGEWLRRVAATDVVYTLPQRTLEFREFAVQITRVAVDVRPVMIGDPIASKAERANLQNNLSTHLSAAGRPKEALEVALKAVMGYRKLAAENADVFSPDLGGVLNNTANYFSDLGRREDALVTALEAVALYRDLTNTHPNAFRPDLAMSLSNAAKFHSELAQCEKALELSREAVLTYRFLADACPGSFLAELAASLNNIANCYSDLGWREDALDSVNEAVAIYRALAVERPDAFLPELARSLTNASHYFSDVGELEKALDIANEGLAIHRELVAATKRKAFLPNLAESLCSSANRNFSLGRIEEATDMEAEALTIYRELVTDLPEAFRPDLAVLLNNSARSLSTLSRFDEALANAREALAIRRDLAAAHADVFRPSVATSLISIATILSSLGRRKEALAMAQESVAIRRDLAAARPDAFRPDLAMSLGTSGLIFEDMDRWDEARASFEEGARALLDHFHRFPKAFSGLMGVLAKKYLEACEKSDTAPDEALLREVVEVFAKSLKA